MGEQISNSDCNPILVLILGVFSIWGLWSFGWLWQILSVLVFMKAGQPRTIGSAVWACIPIMGLVIGIDNWKVAQKLANGETVDEFHHEIEFLNNLPLLKA